MEVVAAGEIVAVSLVANKHRCCMCSARLPWHGQSIHLPIHLPNGNQLSMTCEWCPYGTTGTTGPRTTGTHSVRFDLYSAATGPVCSPGLPAANERQAGPAQLAVTIVWVSSSGLWALVGAMSVTDHLLSPKAKPFGPDLYDCTLDSKWTKRSLGSEKITIESQRITKESE